jgi:hypothetical protein
VSGGMLGIHQSHHAIESQMMCKMLLHVKSLDDWCWIGKSYMTSKKEKIWFKLSKKRILEAVDTSN